MNIFVLIKQVPGTSKVEIDETTGSLKRSGIESKINPYDLYSIESAVRLKELTGGKVTAITMGPPQAQSILQEAFMMGADEGYLITDRRFAGADTLATSHTLCEAVKAIGPFDIIICGRQTTDGDTAQVGPQISEFLQIPHAAWVNEIEYDGGDSIVLGQDFADKIKRVRVKLPCLITVEKGIYEPRLPSYKRKLSDIPFEIHTLTLDNFSDRDENGYGLKGSPTQVDRIFPPKVNSERIMLEGDCATVVNKLCGVLKDGRFI